MSDLKTSQEAAASALDGTELIRAVQLAGNVAATSLQFRALTLSSPTLPTGSITFNQNVSPPPLAFVGGIQLVITDGLTQGYVLDTFAANGNNVFRRANGTNAIKSQLLNGDIIGALTFRGYDGSAAYSGNTAAIQIKTAEDWIDATHHGSTMTLGVTPAGTVSQAGVLTLTGVSGSNRVGIGTETNPQATLVVSANITTGVVGSVAAPLVKIVSLDGFNAQLEMQSFTNSAAAAGVTPNFFFTTSGGTAASPSGVKATQILGQFGGRGFSATGAYTATVAQIQFGAAEDFVLGQTGTFLTFRTTPIATAATVEAMRITSASGIPVAVGIGTSVPDSLLTVDANTGASVTPIAGTNLHVVGADATANRITMNSYGTFSALNASHSLGTQASKLVSSAGNIMFSFGAAGWNGSAYQASSAIAFIAGETFSGTASGGYVSFFTVPLTTITTAETVRFQPSGGVSIGSTAVATDPGIGNLLVQGMYRSSTAPTAIAGAGPFAIGSASTLNNRMKVNLNGTDYWIPCSTTAY